MFQHADENGSKVGTGGMKSKLLAAQTALYLGVSVFIGTGFGRNKLLDVLEGKGDGTYIANRSQTSINTKRQWIALHSESTGHLYIDQGAVEAILYHGKSLIITRYFQSSRCFSKKVMLLK